MPEAFLIKNAWKGEKTQLGKAPHHDKEVAEITHAFGC